MSRAAASLWLDSRFPRSTPDCEHRSICYPLGYPQRFPPDSTAAGTVGCRPGSTKRGRDLEICTSRTPCSPRARFWRRAQGRSRPTGIHNVAHTCHARCHRGHTPLRHSGVAASPHRALQAMTPLLHCADLVGIDARHDVSRGTIEAANAVGRGWRLTWFPLECGRTGKDLRHGPAAAPSCPGARPVLARVVRPTRSRGKQRGRAAKPKAAHTARTLRPPIFGCFTCNSHFESAEAPLFTVSRATRARPNCHTCKDGRSSRGCVRAQVSREAPWVRSGAPSWRFPRHRQVTATEDDNRREPSRER